MILLQYFIDQFLIRYVVKIAYQFQSESGDKFSNTQTMLTTLDFAPLPLLNKQE